MFVTFNLTQKHLSVLIALQENPLATYDWLSRRVGLSKSIVFGIIQDLSSHRQQYFSVVANTNLWNLGLENIDILVEADKETKLQFVEQLCYEHPYTFYRARCFGDINGLLVQFNIPIGTRPLLHEIFEICQEKKLIDAFTFLPFEDVQPIFSAPNVDHWNPITSSWSFDWEEWFKKKVKTTSPTQPKEEQGVAKKWLNEEKVAIIHQLVKNARRKNVEIIADLEEKGYDFTPQTFSRYLRKVKKLCITDYRVFLAPNIFDLYSTVLIWGSAPEKVLQDIQSRMLKFSIPFSSTFKIRDQHLFWYLHLPPTHLSDILHHLRHTLTDMHFNYIDYNRAKAYLPWPLTFDDETSDWKQNRAFIVDSVLENLEV